MRLFPVVILFLLISTGCEKKTADLIIRNAVIYTVDEAFSLAEAMAIKGDTIMAIGAEYEILNEYRADRVVDVKKRTIYPGFIDAHCHYYGYGMALERVNLVGTSSFQEVVNEVITYNKTNSEEWIIGRGWDQNDWKLKEYPDRQILDSLFPHTPVFLQRIDGHAAIVNEEAMRRSGIVPETIIEGGILERKDGRLTGILIDNAVELVKTHIPEPSTATKANALISAEKECLRVGLTTVDDAGLDKDILDLIDSLQQRGELSLKVYGMLNPSKENLDHYLTKGPYKTNRLHINAFKIYADGALGSRGAQLLESYADIDHDHRGLLIHDQQYFKEIAQKCYDAGFQMNTHAIGDSANRLILQTYASILNGTNDKRWRIEHAQVLHPNDLRYFRENTIIPSVQPTHATSDMPWAHERLGPERIKTAYAYQKLMQQNGMIALGTDFPVESHHPIHTFYAAVFRKDHSGKPTHGFNMQDALSREEALKGMTIWAAISNFEEHEKGSLAPGKAADFVVLDRDIMKVDPPSVLESRILQTYINGKEVHRSQ